MKKVGIVLLMTIILCGCSSKNKETTKESNPPAYEQIMDENEFIILDVRTKSEYEESHIVGAINIPYDEINKDTDLDKEKAIFVYCKSGSRSKIAYNTLKELGYDVYDLGAFNSIDLPKE